MGDKKRIINIADIHHGNILSATGLVRKEIIEKYRSDPNTYFFLGGDECDMIVSVTGDKRFSPAFIHPDYASVDDPVDKQIDGFVELVWPIRDKILCIVDSNHHRTITKKCGTNPTRRIAYTLWGAKEAEKKIMGYAGFVVLQFYYDSINEARHRSFIFYITHGITTGGKTEGGHITSIGKAAENYVADVFMFAHNHQLDAWDRIKIYPNVRRMKIESKKEIRIDSGSFLKAYSDDETTSYAEEKGYRPNQLGFVELNIEFTRSGEHLSYIKRSFL